MPDHDAVSRRVFGVTLETVTRRILATFDRATPADIERGARWYDVAGQLAAELAGPDLTLEQSASVIAALSPRTPWARNVAGAVSLIRTGDAPGCLRRNVDTARRAMTAGFDTFGARAPKTAAFARNITGDRESVTVDVWACRAASLDDELITRAGAYVAVAHAYRLAARRRGVDPATMQATTWIVARNGRAS